MTTDSPEGLAPSDLELRVREIALREAVNRANVVNGADVVELAARYERYLWRGRPKR